MSVARAAGSDPSGRSEARSSTALRDVAGQSFGRVDRAADVSRLMHGHFLRWTALLFADKDPSFAFEVIASLECAAGPNNLENLGSQNIS